MPLWASVGAKRSSFPQPAVASPLGEEEDALPLIPPWGVPADPVDAPSPLAGRLAHWQNRFRKILRIFPQRPVPAALVSALRNLRSCFRTAASAQHLLMDLGQRDRGRN